MKCRFSAARAFVLSVAAVLGAMFSLHGQTNPTAGLTAVRSGNDIILSFPASSGVLFTLQTRPDLVGQWSNFQSILGDGSLKTVTIPNAIATGKGFYRLLIQPKPSALSLPQTTAFGILGYSCGGIQEKVYVTGFDSNTGYPAGVVYLSTTCSSGGRGSRPVTHSASASVVWDFAGNVVSATVLASGPTVNQTFTATDAFGDTIYNSSGAAYLSVPTPAVPTAVTATQSGDQFQVSWTPNGVNPVAVTSTTLTATPVNSTAPVLTVTVTGSAATGIIPTLQPQTTYQITVVTTSLSGSSLASAPISVTTVPASVAPAAPTGVTAKWTDLNPAGATDTLLATWQAAVPGDSPVDQYRIVISGSDGGGAFTQTVSGTTLTTSFTVDYVPNWTVTVQAHNAVGWGSASTGFTLGGL